jgi:hypothetical protein
MKNEPLCFAWGTLMVIKSEIVTHEMSQKVLQVMIIIYIVRVHTQNTAVCFACQSIFNVNLIFEDFL